MDNKPGYLTTEFWTALFTLVISLVTLLKADLNSDKLSALVGPMALLVTGLVSAAYSQSRAKVKSGTTSGPISAGGDVSVETNAGDAGHADAGLLELVLVILIAVGVLFTLMKLY